MKAYLLTTAIIFGLITVAHIWRVIVEWSHLRGELFYHLLTLTTAALCGWACVLLRKNPR